LIFISAPTVAEEPQPVFNVDGGVAIGGKEVIDENGKWVGNPTGLQGPQGVPGPKGPQGIQGPTGPVGAGISCNWAGWKQSEYGLSCNQCVRFHASLNLYCSGGTITQAAAVNVCIECSGGQ
jgi:hypothetical protein